MEAETPETPVGRPSLYTTELATRICDALIEGRSVRSLCLDEDMPSESSVYNWLQDNAEFLERYTRARASQAERMLDEIIEIADDTSGDTEYGDSGPKPNNEWINRSKLRVETRKWAMSKLAPKKYGDKLDVTSGDKPLPGKTIIKIGGKRPKAPDAADPADA